jgi:hypothetical protein
VGETCEETMKTESANIHESVIIPVPHDPNIAGGDEPARPFHFI